MKKISFIFLAFNFGYLTVLSQEPGDNLFGQPVHTVQIQFSQPGWADSLEYYYQINDTAQNAIYLKGDVTVDGVTYPNVGVRYKGNSSYNNPTPKKSLKLDFNEFVSGQKIDGLKAINLHNSFKDPTMLREKIMLDFLNQRGVHAPRCVYANVYINGQLYGLYTLVEEVDDSPFLKTHFGNKSGNLYRGDPSGSLQWLGNQQSAYYSHYELKTNEDVNDWSDLVSLIDVINNSTNSNDFYTNLESQMSTSSYLKLRSANIIFANLDSYDGSGHNYYIYNDNGKFKWIAWDVNEAFGNFKYGLTINQLECLSLFYIPNPPGSRPLPEKMFSMYPAYKTQMADIVYQWLDTFPPAKMDSIIDTLANIIRPYVYADNNKAYTNQHFETNLSQNISVPGPNGFEQIPGLKSFYAARYQCLKNELISLGYWPLNVEEKEVFTSKVYPNPAEEFINFEWNGYRGEYKLIDFSGKIVETGYWSDRGTLNLEKYPKGVYLLLLTNEQLNQQSHKIIH
ncbi:MAG: hypothetical protein KatS3mg034_0505 [Vicingaceae bacterium]|nr:MAG: hypothetical protein KatS3mg034_0505 [Vicingaceae bacterium]